MLRNALRTTSTTASLRAAGLSSIRQAHTISTPTLIHLEKRWDTLSPQEQADLQSQLAKRQEGPWTELTPEEKRAAYFIAFGAHGPRAETHPPGFQIKVLTGTLIGLGMSAVLFYGIRTTAQPAPKTMSREYQEAMNERLREQNAEPISGVSSEGYKGKGMVQSD
ncbi:putative cytochrome c oxidase polypeptide 5, mitochondrial [Protomyces lactucae-debilis]|uniref:Putative cytochrome c oxidase polypeptide 5, mitochondrial n=1 Tax=Protomyces lactucae-debilis TaxID=2754530 RepID=A0A1Y2F3Z6_PROLT|nr:putative cytochrome c oxidase polypeptide 5, mitochondrial [Protomyces lactucae-debilis]ORY78638.1 putative cytochrome c oxidase polypeptide 5, mitochondrial [Protomyces lactucae-debilis]